MSWKIPVRKSEFLTCIALSIFFFPFELSTSCCIFSRFAVFSNVFYVFSRFAVFSHILSVLSRVLLYFLFILACFSHLFAILNWVSVLVANLSIKALWNDMTNSQKCCVCKFIYFCLSFWCSVVFATQVNEFFSLVWVKIWSATKFIFCKEWNKFKRIQRMILFFKLTYCFV